MIPKHVAIIMDGNGRWAERRNHPRVYGHVRGSARIKPIVREASRLGVRALTLFAFSTENWARPDAEKDVLWKLLRKFLAREIESLERENVRLRIFGEVERLDPGLRDLIQDATQRLSRNTGLQLNFAVSYGSRAEILRATQLFARDCVEGKRSPSQMTDELFQEYLWTSELKSLGSVDLVIRTSGEKRISNFLLWQAAYAEFVFLDTLWPDFSADHFRSAVDEYGKRERRFGLARSQLPMGAVT